MSALRRLCENIVNSPYVSRWVVLGIDSVASAVATGIVYLTIGFFIRSSAPAMTYGCILLSSFAVSTGIFLLCGTYKGIIRHTTMREVWRIFLAVVLKSAVLLGVLCLLRSVFRMTLDARKIAIGEMLDIMFSLFMLVTLRAVLISIYGLFMDSVKRATKRVLIYGEDNESISLASYLANSKYAEYRVIGYVVLGTKIKRLQLSGLPVYTIDSYAYFNEVIRKKGVNAIVFPDQKSALEEKGRLIDYCIKEHINVYLLPQLGKVSDPRNITAHIRKIGVEELLGREEITVNMGEIQQFLSGKVVLVTGAAGSIGSELCRLISGFDISQLLLLDNAETPLYNIQQELTDRAHRNGTFDPEAFERKYKFLIADVRNRARIEALFDHYRPQIIFHAAAYKHVPMMEWNPCEAVNVNVMGTRIVADAAVKIGTEKMIMISTDKAVNPTNVMGASKRIAEIYVQSLSRAIMSGEHEGRTKFVTTRFGNVLGSNGSVILRFREQIKAGGPVTVTHKDIIRYFMTIPEACRLVLEAATMGEGYEIFVFDMGEPVRIARLAENMISLAGFKPGEEIQIEYTGLRPGEKLYEELLNCQEHIIPTANKKISVAKVKEYKYTEVVSQLTELKAHAKVAQTMETVRIMKEIVPEFKSQNSVYSVLDDGGEVKAAV